MKYPEELLEYINKNTEELCGELKIDGNNLYWYYYEDCWDMDDVDDMLWSVYCEDSNDIQKILPKGFEITGGWQDNDSTGFDIVKL